MKIKFLCAAAALGIAGASQVAYADAPAPTPEFTVTGDAAIVSQYKFRGISQSDNKPAAQMAITVTDASGFYVATWGSSGTNGPLTPNGGTEIDVYGGYGKTIAGYSLDGGVYGYIYPNLAGNNLFEVYGDVSKSFGPIGTKIGLNWAPKQHYFSFNNPTGTQYSMYEYVEFTYSPASLSALTLHSHIGHTGGGLNYVKEYMDYTAGVSYKWKNLTFDVSGVGTNVGKGDSHANPYFYNGMADPGDTHRLAKSVAVVSVTASF